MQVVSQDQDANLEKIKQAFAFAHKEQAHFLVFPEKCDGIIDDRVYVHEKTCQFLDTIQNMAKEYGLHVIVPLLFQEANRHYNRAFLIDDTGSIMGHYDKQKIILGSEDIYTTPGVRSPVFATCHGPVALSICLDITNPFLYDHYKRQGAHIVFCPAMWEDHLVYNGKNLYTQIDAKRAAHAVVRKVVEGRAIENELFIVFCNAVGTINYKNVVFTSSGQSHVSGPLYGLVGSIDHADEELKVIDIDLDLINHAAEYCLFR